MKKSRMFSHVTSTWNPITGCRHNCKYCWARKLSLTKLKGIPHYARHGFKPALNEKMFRRRFKPGELVFVSDMGDMWGIWVPEDWILKVLNHVKKFPRTKFLFLTKNPRRYGEFVDILGEMDNIILGATIETDRSLDYLAWKISDAPTPDARLAGMLYLRYKGFDNLMVSIEPILDFSMDTFVEMIKQIKPRLVYVGYDNYNNKLPEPPLEKTLKLVEELKKFTNVYTKTIRKAWWEKH